jgi:hypothetical protein
MKRYGTFIGALTLAGMAAGLFTPLPTRAQDADPPRRSGRILGPAKRLSFADEAVGVQTKGQLQNLTMNYGMISDTRFEDVGNAPTDIFFDFRYPRENFTGVVDDFGLFFAIRENSKNGDKGNVIDAWTDNGNEDFIALDGSYGRTHYNPALDPSPHAALKYNNQTPYLAHSDLTATWPVDAPGVAVWPGLFRRDPVTGVQVPGEFASDRDIYMEFNDKNNQLGDVVGIEVHEMAYTYGRVYAEDVLFYEFFVINKSGRTLTGCYFGTYQDPDCSDHTEETLLVKDSLFADGTRVWAVADRDFDGDIGGATRPNSVGIMEDYTFGTAFFETPRDLGVTDFHYFVDPGPTDDAYLWPVITSDPTNPVIAATAGNYFHGSNRRMDDVSLITTKQDLAWTVATGPFDMAPGDTVKLTLAAVVGDDDADYYSNLWEAKKLFDARFNGPTAPPAPRLSAASGDRRVTLYWDDIPEISKDPATGEQDFEGYKIYRSQDGGITWGTRTTDALGRTAGYVPIAQFDLADNIKGLDPKNPLAWLGTDSGLRHSWVDSNVVNGIAYSYTIVSYDRGTSTLYSLESTRGDGPQVDNFVTVTPLPPATGRTSAALKSLTRSAGTGKGEITIDVIDESLLGTTPYRLTFTGTPAQSFSVTRMDGPGTVLYRNKPVNTPDLAVVDGFRVAVATGSVIGGIESVTDGKGRNVLGAANPSADSSWYISTVQNAQADTAAKTADYEIRFSSPGAIAYSWGVAGSTAKYSVPFAVWNTTSNATVAFEIRDLNNNQQWDEGETIYITRAPYPSPAPAIGSPNPATDIKQFAYQVSINNLPSDTARRPPSQGTVIRITSNNPYRAGDAYQFDFNPGSFDPARADLSLIRVVPNPYIVTSQYENTQNVRQIRFMFLPPECTIRIYTVAGVLVKTLYHNSSVGSLAWNLVSDWSQALAFGVYVYVAEDPHGNRSVGRFSLIK